MKQLILEKKLNNPIDNRIQYVKNKLKIDINRCKIETDR